MKSSASPSFLPQVLSRSFSFSSSPAAVVKSSSLSSALPALFLKGIDDLSLAGVAAAVELLLFLVGSPKLGGFAGTEVLLPDDRLSGVTVRFLDPLWSVFGSTSLELLARILLRGDLLLPVPLDLAEDLSL